MIGRSDPAAPPRRRLAMSHWALILAGPVVGTVYFFAVYLLAEASCAEGVELLSSATLRAVVLGSAAGSGAVLLLCVGRAQRLWRSDTERPQDAAAADRRDNRRFMLVVGVLLLAMFLLFVAFLAAPAAEGSLC
jgi:hypothetical protein